MIRLEKLTWDNYDDVLKLKVAKKQEKAGKAQVLSRPLFYIITKKGLLRPSISHRMCFIEFVIDPSEMSTKKRNRTSSKMTLYRHILMVSDPHKKRA